MWRRRNAVEGGLRVRISDLASAGDSVCVCSSDVCSDAHVGSEVGHSRSLATDMGSRERDILIDLRQAKLSAASGGQYGGLDSEAMFDFKVGGQF